MTLWDARWLVIDTETTGVDIETARVCELGFVPFHRGQPLAKYGRLLNPGVPIPADATTVHGITDDDVADCPRIEDVAERFLDHVRQAEVLVGYNLYGYDGPLLGRLLGRSWTEVAVCVPRIDPLVLIRMDGVGRYWQGHGRHKLTAVAKRFGLPIPASAHRSTTDCLLAGMVLWELRNHAGAQDLPAEPFDLERVLLQAKDRQDADFAAWLASQPQASAGGAA